ncbi:ATP-dependent Clp protease proteolytic subunit [Anderseniella sp. Alg231-50]|uniref:ATP-dependent Clp protease proteolytic subunit n=1 Tax=Anderseniella sp. Alg231-50 TaxID=1922226 RepID=UPI000D560A0D
MSTNRLVLFGLVVVAVLMGWRLYEQKHADTGQLAVHQSGDVVVLSWSGEVDLPMHTLLMRAFEERRTTSKRFLLRLNSPGGSVREGGDVVELLQRIKRTHTLDTYVASRDICMSMCVPIFLQGSGRIAATDARFMFHEPKRFYDDGSEAKGFSFERQALTRRFFTRYFVNSPMNANWRIQLEKDWVGKDIYKSGKQLVEENSGIVTNLR